MLIGSVMALFLNSIVGLSIVSFHDIDVFKYLTFQIYLQFIPVSYAIVVKWYALIKQNCCSICNVWHHLHGWGLSTEGFLQHTRNKNLFWECPKCVIYRCGKWSRVLGKCGCILCNCCNKWFHKRCPFLEIDKFVKLGHCEEPWFCSIYMTNNLSFYALDEKK